jgi:hypothetical protein
MAKSSLEIVVALRKTAGRLLKSSQYQWGHMGSCNCGFLAQEVTSLTRDQIHSRAMVGLGDWSEQLNDYCPTSGRPMDEVIDALIRFGFSTDDLRNLERLSDPLILRAINATERPLHHNVKADVVTYLIKWAEIVEVALLDEIHLPELSSGSVIARAADTAMHNL